MNNLENINRKTKIIATIGPASRDPKVLSAMIDAGMDVARLNFSHGSYEDHKEAINAIRMLSAQKKRPVAILQDLQGPKVRIGVIPGGKMEITAGRLIDIYFSPKISEVHPDGPPDRPWIYIPMPGLQQRLKADMRILLDDGNIEFVIQSSQTNKVTASVNLGGILSSNKGFNLPGVELDIPGFTEKDRNDLLFGLQHGVDLVAISFVRTAEDVNAVKSIIQANYTGEFPVPVIAKLERPEALDNLDSIIQVADGLMVARGDLGVELSPAMVPIAQKRIIRAANLHSIPVITATQMLDSMIHNPRPTRAEATDVANAIFDGTDAVMLSGETASGSYPLETIKVMGSIICKAEANFAEWTTCGNEGSLSFHDDATAITRAARELARDRNVQAIAVFTHSGKTARLMSKIKPDVPILAFTPLESTYRRMALLRGTTPYLVPFADNTETMIQIVDEAIQQLLPDSQNMQVVVITGFPVDKMRSPNLALLHTVGEVA